MGGNILLSSTENVGTTVSFTLPITHTKPTKQLQPLLQQLQQSPQEQAPIDQQPVPQPATPLQQPRQQRLPEGNATTATPPTESTTTTATTAELPTKIKTKTTIAEPTVTTTTEEATITTEAITKIITTVEPTQHKDETIDLSAAILTNSEVLERVVGLYIATLPVMSCIFYD